MLGIFILFFGVLVFRFYVEIFFLCYIYLRLLIGFRKGFLGIMINGFWNKEEEGLGEKYYFFFVDLEVSVCVDRFCICYC